MTKGIVALVAIAGAAAALAQQPAEPPKPPAPPASPVAKQPKPKTQKEIAAIQAMFNATTPDERIAAAKALITGFADSEFRPLAWQLIAASYQQKNDEDNMIAAAEELLKIDPKNFNAMIMIAGSLARRTREFDLDKEEKLGRAEKLAAQARAAIKTAPRPNPQVTDEQWAAAKKDFDAQVSEALGLCALARKNYPLAIKHFKEALQNANQPDQTTMVRLANAHIEAKQYNEAITVLDQVLAMPNLHPAVKQFAEQEKKRATVLKDAKPAAGPAQPSVMPEPVPVAPKP
jgi:tetratricopeptide (TPR) repeat protein